MLTRALQQKACLIVYPIMRTKTFAIAAVAVLLYLLSATVTWRGIGDWDATYYIKAALQWYESGAYLGDTHWQIRYPMVLPIVGSLTVFGPSELTTTLPNLAFAILLIVASAVWGDRFLGRTTGTCFALLLATSPALVLQPLEIEIRGPELFFSALALWLFVTGMNRDDGTTRLLLAGLAAGAAWLCREVAAYLLPTFLLAGLLLATKARRWPSMFIPAASFFAVLIAEMTLYWFAADDPFYRYRIDLGHGGDTPGTEFAPGMDDGGGLIFLPVEPLIKHLADPTTGLFIATAAIAAVIIIFGYRNLAASARQVLGVFSIGAATSYLLSSLALNLEHPNYYPLLNYWALLLIALAAGLVWHWGYRWLTAATILTLILAGLFAAGIGERYEFDYYRHAASLAKAEDKPLVTSFRVRERAELLLRLEGWTEAEASEEFASHDFPKTGRLAFRPGYAWLEREFILGSEWTLQGEWYPSDLAWQHRLLAAFAEWTHLPLRPPTPPPAVILLRKSTDGA